MTTGYHLAVDAVGAKLGGAAAIVLGTLAAAADCAEIERVTLYCSPRSERRFKLPVADWLDVEDRPDEEGSRSARLRWLTGHLGATACRRGADALLALNGASGAVPGVAPELPTLVFAQQSIPLSAEAMARLEPGDGLRMLVIRALLWDACRRADRVAVQTAWMREALVRQLGANPERVVVVGTTSKPLSEDGSPPRHVGKFEETRGSAVLYVGSDAPYKNLSVLIAAMQPVRRARPQARLFATLPTGHMLESADVVCLGFLEDSALAAYYSSADVFVLPSLVESAGLPLLEAMSFGVPVVAADRPYAHDMCGGAALYFDPNDPTALADRVLTVLGDEALRARLRRAGLERARRFREARPYGRLVELAVSLAGGAALGRSAQRG